LIINGKDLPVIPKITKIGEINLVTPTEADYPKTIIKSDY